MLTRIRILQIGDIHLPNSSKARTSTDDKDIRFSAGIKDIISAPPIKTVFRQIYKIIEGGDVDALIFMGDLTDYGDITGYAACAKYIARSLQVGSDGIHNDLPTRVLPGNHDINRDLAKAIGLNAKFTPLQQALSEAGLVQFSLHTPGWVRLKTEHAAIAVALLNSCWGCGATDYIPEEFRESVSRAIDISLTSGNAEKATKAYYDRQLDTPAFADATIQALATYAAESDNSELLIACAHHNLLPQRQPRLAPYTEIVNAGALRSALAELRRPILYLHGHIHDDPVEILTGPEGDPLVCISAPLVTNGFNVLDLFFTRTGAPLSCHLHKWRINSAGTIRKLAPTVLPLLGPRRRSHDRNLSRLYAYLLENREVYWGDLLLKASEYYTANTEIQLIEALELLSMDGRVKIDNYDRPPTNWILGASL